MSPGERALDRADDGRTAARAGQHPAGREAGRPEAQGLWAHRASPLALTADLSFFSKMGWLPAQGASGGWSTVTLATAHLLHTHTHSFWGPRPPHHLLTHTHTPLPTHTHPHQHTHTHTLLHTHTHPPTHTHTHTLLHTHTHTHTHTHSFRDPRPPPSWVQPSPINRGGLGLRAAPWPLMGLVPGLGGAEPRPGTGVGAWLQTPKLHGVVCISSGFPQKMSSTIPVE